MNDRIVVIAEIAGLKIEGTDQEAALDKFTKLLVSDCIDVIEHVDNPGKYNLSEAIDRIKAMLITYYGTA